MRYKFYREHKYVSFKFNELERLIAKTDFKDIKELNKVKEEFEQLAQLLVAHAQYENDSLHVLLKRKNSAVYKHIEQDHEHLDKQIISLRDMLNKISYTSIEEDKIESGYQFYLFFRKFVGENLMHLHEEETIILPELQRLYTDRELKQVESETYKLMTVQEIIDMLEELFPHMNPSDREAFLLDIKESGPEKFKQLWNKIKLKLSCKEQIDLSKKLSLD